MKKIIFLCLMISSIETINLYATKNNIEEIKIENTNDVDSTVNANIELLDNIDNLDQLLNLDLPAPKLDNPSFLKIWFRQAGISVFYTLLNQYYNIKNWIFRVTKKNTPQVEDIND